MSSFLLRYHKPNVRLYGKLLAGSVPASGCFANIVSSGLFPVKHKNVSECNLQSLSRFSTNGCSRMSFNDKLKQELLPALKKVDFNELKHSPVAANVYGFGGIVPFVFPPLYFIVGSFSPFLASAQLMYGAAILAFVGGVKWGNALAKDEVTHEQIGLSTVPSLVAWSSLLVPEPVGYLVVSAGLVGALSIDLLSSKYPPWFVAMRCTLTSIATASLLTTLVFYVFN